MERRGQQFAALIALQEERKSKGGKQLWTCRRREQGQRGNPFLVEGKHMDGVRRPSRVGAVAALITVQTNLTITIATALVGALGPAAIAGYGLGTRLEYLLIPLVFPFCRPLVAMVGTNIGARRPERALRVAWIGA